MARDRLGLAALLCVDARPGAGGVDQGDDRQVEAVGKLHQARRLAIPLGARHAEIVAQAARRVVALFVADEADRAPTKASEPADDRGVLGEFAVAGQRCEVFDEAFDVVAEMRPALDARDLRLLPRRQRSVEIGEHLGGLRLELGDFLAEGRGLPFGGEGAQLVDARVDVGHGRFETRISAHMTLQRTRP